jgi:hypothetical protein
MNKRTAQGRPFLRQLALALSLAGLVILAVLLIPEKESATMLPTATSLDTMTAIPPIDANAPTQTRTATFAMG